MILAQNIPGKDTPAATVLAAEGLPAVKAMPPNVFKNNELVNTAHSLFGFVLPEDDARWHLADAALTVKSNNHKLKGLHFEAARQSIYLSKSETLKNEIAHWARVIHNLGSIDQISKAFDLTKPDYYPDALSASYAVTDNFSLERDKQGITGCPEALHQIRLFQQSTSGEKTYIARIGSNLHFEDTRPVISITNLQGTPQRQEFYKKFKEAYGVNPFNFLVLRVKALAATLAPDCVVRGLKNPRHRESSPLYNTTLKLRKSLVLKPVSQHLA